MKLLSIQVGRPIGVPYLGKEITTGIFKSVVNGPVFVKELNLDGDEQADLRVHGGRDKAIYAYGADTYPTWKTLRPQDEFPNGAMGENLSFTSLPEDQMHIGDTYELGDAVLQVAQPRFPCHKLGIKFGEMEILKQFIALKRPGVYFRVLKEGMIEAGNELNLIQAETVKLSVLEIFNVQFGEKMKQERVKEILQLSTLPENWKIKFEKMLESHS